MTTPDRAAPRTEAADILAAHFPYKKFSAWPERPQDRCSRCGLPWPCDAVRLNAVLSGEAAAAPALDVDGLRRALYSSSVTHGYHIDGRHDCREYVIGDCALARPTLPGDRDPARDREIELIVDENMRMAAELGDRDRREAPRMSERDVLMEFVQWLVDNPAHIDEIFDDPEDEDSADYATEAIDRFLASQGIAAAPGQAGPPESET